MRTVDLLHPPGSERLSAFLPFPDGVLFDAGWLSALSDEVPRAEALDRARPVVADAIARTSNDTERAFLAEQRAQLVQSTAAAPR